MALEYELSVPETARDGSPLIVLLHGRGSNRHDLMGLRRGLPFDAIVAAPEAPFPSAPWGYGSGWAWYRYLGEDRPEPESFEASQNALAEFMRDVPDLLPVRPGLTALGGFSQGGTMSLAHALMFSGSVTHVLNLSGFLANHPLVRLDPEALAAVRIFWGHGTHDPAIPHEMAVAGRAKLAAAGADLTARDYPMGHTIDPRELTDVTQWLGEGATSSPSTGDR